MFNSYSDLLAFSLKGSQISHRLYDLYFFQKINSSETLEDYQRLLTLTLASMAVLKGLVRVADPDVSLPEALEDSLHGLPEGFPGTLYIKSIMQMGVTDCLYSYRYTHEEISAPSGMEVVIDRIRENLPLYLSVLDATVKHLGHPEEEEEEEEVDAGDEVIH